MNKFSAVRKASDSPSPSLQVFGPCISPHTAWGLCWHTRGPLSLSRVHILHAAQDLIQEEPWEALTPLHDKADLIRESHWQ